MMDFNMKLSKKVYFGTIAIVVLQLFTLVLFFGVNFYPALAFALSTIIYGVLRMSVRALEEEEANDNDNT